MKRSRYSQPRDARGRYGHKPRAVYRGPWWGPVLVFVVLVLLVVVSA
ncbi:hypothetical protein AB0C68_38515 [Streptomyces tendae]